MPPFWAVRWNRPWWIFRAHDYQTWEFRAWNFGGDRTLDGISIGGSSTLNSFWSQRFQMGYRPGYMNDRLTRGGPIAANPPQRHFATGVTTDDRQKVVLRGDVFYRSDNQGWRERGFQGGVDVRPGTAVRMRLNPRIDLNELPAQYLSAFADPRVTNTFGARYVFAELEQSTVSLETRLDWTLTPALSLQLFAQPFVSAGSYSNFKEFARPRTYEFDVYSRERGAICQVVPTKLVNPLENSSCPTTAASGMRRGSTCFSRIPTSMCGPCAAMLSRVGNTARAPRCSSSGSSSAAEAFGDVELVRDAGAISREPAQNVVLVKATYWFGS